MVFSHINHIIFFSTRAQYLPCPSRNESGLAGSRAACWALLCFSAEAGECDEWAGDCRERRTGLLDKVLGSCWKEPSFPTESLSLCYISFLFDFFFCLKWLSLKCGGSTFSQRGKVKEVGENSGAYDQRHHSTALNTQVKSGLGQSLGSIH